VRRRSYSGSVFLYWVRVKYFESNSSAHGDVMGGIQIFARGCKDEFFCFGVHLPRSWNGLMFTRGIDHGGFAE
jgi:hypothetical protein